MKTKFHPILFSTPMVQAILDDRKRQTRRTKGLEQVNDNLDIILDLKIITDSDKTYALVRTKSNGTYKVLCPYNVGDVFWVRETFEMAPVQKASVYSTDDLIEEKVNYKADGTECFKKWKPSIFMPKPACRIFLKIKSIRVEKLQEISEKDAIAEGVKDDGFFEGLYNYYNYLIKVFDFKTAKDSFQSLWHSINGNESWDSNPFVWVYEFEKIEKPNDFLG